MTTVEAPVSHLRENPYEIAKDQLRKVAETFAIDPNLVRVLSACADLAAGSDRGDRGSGLNERHVS